MGLLLISISLTTSAQESCPNLYDSNSNGTIDIEDFLAVLSLFADVDTDYDGIWDSQDYCTDLEACNYANEPSESCAYVDFLGDCGGSCMGDGDSDGICDDEDDCIGVVDECGICNGPGATEIVIENITIFYDSVYAEQIDQWFVFEVGADTTFNLTCPPPLGCGTLFFSEAGEGSDMNRYLEIYNPTASAVDLTGYALAFVLNTPDNGVGNYDFWFDFPAGAFVAPGDVYIIATYTADSVIIEQADHFLNYVSNGNDGFMLVQGDEASYIQIDAVGDWNGDPGTGWDVAGVISATKDHTLVRKSTVQTGNEGEWVTSVGTSAIDSEWIVLDQDDWTNLGEHEFQGCENP